MNRGSIRSHNLPSHRPQKWSSPGKVFVQSVARHLFVANYCPKVQAQFLEGALACFQQCQNRNLEEMNNKME